MKKTSKPAKVSPEVEKMARKLHAIGTGAMRAHPDYKGREWRHPNVADVWDADVSEPQKAAHRMTAAYVLSLKPRAPK